MQEKLDEQTKVRGVSDLVHEHLLCPFPLDHYNCSSLFIPQATLTAEDGIASLESRMASLRQYLHQIFFPDFHLLFLFLLQATHTAEDSFASLELPMASVHFKTILTSALISCSFLCCRLHSQQRTASPA